MDMNPINWGSEKESRAKKNSINDILEDLKVLNNNILTVNDNTHTSFDRLYKKIDDVLTITNTKTEIEEFKKLIKEEIMEGIKKSIRKGYYPDNTIIDANTSAAKELEKSISETKELMKNICNLQLQEVNQQFKELMEKRQENKNLEKKIESWQDSAVEFFQFIERTLGLISESDTQKDSTNKESIDPKLVIYKKILKDFERRVNPLGLHIICPQSSEDVNESLHKVVAEKELEEVQEGQIIECQKWGYAINGKLYDNMRAEVIVAKSPEHNEKANQDIESEKEKLEPSSSKENDPQALAKNSEKPDNNALESGSVNGTNEPNETSLNKPKIINADENDSPSDSNLNKLGEDGKNNLQSSHAEHTTTSE